MKYTEEQIIDLAKQVELGDSIDWDDTHVDRDRVYQVIGSQVIEHYADWAESDDKDAVMLATIIKLVIENYVLNIRLQSFY